MAIACDSDRLDAGPGSGNYSHFLVLTIGVIRNERYDRNKKYFIVKPIMPNRLDKTCINQLLAIW